MNRTCSCPCFDESCAEQCIIFVGLDLFIRQVGLLFRSDQLRSTVGDYIRGVLLHNTFSCFLKERLVLEDDLVYLEKERLQKRVHEIGASENSQEN